MVNVIPFRGVRYNREKISDFNLVVTAPYDKIDDQLQDEYYNRSEYNFVRLDLNRDENRYESARQHLQSWMSEGVLIRDEKPCIYLYTQEYEFEGVRKIRKGFISLLEVDDFENGNVLPHEQTLSGPKKDRFDLLTATESTFGQIFMLYSDPEDVIMKGLAQVENSEPDIKVLDDDGNTHTVWVIFDENLIKHVQNEMKKQKVYIADGHHRYETSINYRNIQREKLGNFVGDELFNYTMCTFINMDDESGMSILPTHRFIKNVENIDFSQFLKRLEDSFDIQPFSSVDEMYEKLKENRSNHSFGLIGPDANQIFLLTLKGNKNPTALIQGNYSDNLKKLDIMILHKVILEEMLGIDEEVLRAKTHVGYYRDKDKAVAALKKGEYQMGFLVNSMEIHEVKRITEGGEKMPQKSTDFYPKLISGLVINYLK